MLTVRQYMLAIHYWWIPGSYHTHECSSKLSVYH